MTHNFINGRMVPPLRALNVERTSHQKKPDYAVGTLKGKFKVRCSQNFVFTLSLLPLSKTSSVVSPFPTLDVPSAPLRTSEFVMSVSCLALQCQLGIIVRFVVDRNSLSLLFFILTIMKTRIEPLNKPALFDGTLSNLLLHFIDGEYT